MNRLSRVADVAARSMKRDGLLAKYLKQRSWGIVASMLFLVDIYTKIFKSISEVKGIMRRVAAQFHNGNGCI